MTLTEMQAEVSRKYDEAKQSAKSWDRELDKLRRGLPYGEAFKCYPNSKAAYDMVSFYNGRLCALLDLADLLACEKHDGGGMIHILDCLNSKLEYKRGSIYYKHEIKELLYWVRRNLERDWGSEKTYRILARTDKSLKFDMNGLRVNDGD